MTPFAIGRIKVTRDPGYIPVKFAMKGHSILIKMVTSEWFPLVEVAKDTEQAMEILRSDKQFYNIQQYTKV